MRTLWVRRELAKGRSLEDIKEQFKFMNMGIEEFAKEGDIDEYQADIDDEYARTSTEQFIDMYGQKMFDDFVVARDTHFAEKIRSLGSRFPDEKVLAILGSMHVFGDYLGSTYNQLKNLDPRRIKLNSVD